MSKNYPDSIPQEWANNALLEGAYRRGWNHGHGLACHNMPELGKEYWLESEGRVTVDESNVRDVHQELCLQAESHSRCYSPWEHTASEFNSSDYSESLWEAYEAGTTDSIFADLSEYTDEDYGVE